MNLHQLNREEIITKTKSHVNEERKAMSEVLRCLREIERRRIFAEAGYSSLHEFCVRELGYSDGAAHRRISAMRLVRDLPEMDSAIADGSLNLSIASAVQDFFRAEAKEAGKRYTPEEKLRLVESVQGKSRRECEKLLATISPQAIRRERERPVSETETELKLILNDRVLKKLERLKDLTAHKNPDRSNAALIELMADLALEKWDPEMRQRRASPEKLSPSAQGRSRYIASADRKRVWKLHGGQCAYVDPVTGRRCAPRSGLEYDHVTPFARGGKTDAANLRLLCRAHNQLHAIQEFGTDVMKNYVGGLG